MRIESGPGFETEQAKAPKSERKKATPPKKLRHFLKAAVLSALSTVGAFDAAQAQGERQAPDLPPQELYKPAPFPERSAPDIKHVPIQRLEEPEIELPLQNIQLPEQKRRQAESKIDSQTTIEQELTKGAESQPRRANKPKRGRPIEQVPKQQNIPKVVDQGPETFQPRKSRATEAPNTAIAKQDATKMQE